MWLSVHWALNLTLSDLWYFASDGQMPLLWCNKSGLIKGNLCMRITKRDIRIMQKVNQCRWLSTTQLKRLFFPDTTLRAVNKRLKILVDTKYLFAHQPSPTHEIYFRLGHMGKTYLIENSNFNSATIHLPRKFPAQLKHFSKLNDLRIALEALVLKKQARMNFLYHDRDLKGLIGESAIIPDILTSFSLFEKQCEKKVILAIEYDAGTENPQYFGRDKMKKYLRELENQHPLINQLSALVIFADSQKRVVSLLKSSLKYLDNRLKYLFASIDDLEIQADLDSPIYINPQLETGINGLVLQKLLN